MYRIIVREDTIFFVHVQLILAYSVLKSLLFFALLFIFLQIIASNPSPVLPYYRIMF